MFIRVPLVDWGVHWVSMGSLGFDRLIWACRGGAWVHSGSLGSFVGALVFIRFIQVI